MLRAWWSHMFEALAVPQFRVLWIGTLLAYLTFMLAFTAQSVVAFELSGTNRAVGLVALGLGISWVLVGPFAGVVADRMARRRFLLVAQALLVLSFALIGALIITDASHSPGSSPAR